jgi:AraC-like DNA-binding protein
MNLSSRSPYSPSGALLPSRDTGDRESNVAVATVANFAARGILSFAASRGVELSGLIRQSGLEESLLDRPGVRLPLDSVINLWEHARRSTGDEHISLDVAELMPFGSYKTYDLLLATCPTVGDALKKAARYNGYINDAFRLSMQRTRGQISIDYFNCVDSRCNPPEYIEFIFACFLLRFRLTTGVDLRPTEIHFRHSAPRNLAAHYRLFRSTLKFNQPVTRAIMDPSFLRIPQLFADGPTCDLLERHIQTAMARPGAIDELTLALRNTLSGSLASEHVTLPDAARSLGISSRGLQRKLASRGLTYRQFYRAMRCEAALEMLARTETTASQVAESLGFSELSSFSRAFKRWTGSSPRAHREKLSS